ncbi:MAG TPA: TAXI family TRAP transporter solute-binding subunit [Candidatus Limnocylindria bacterium]|nr:TAXI family TRAP transporter solute-binding subunit [Candidatus Limnocylindria bacterium]
MRRSPLTFATIATMLLVAAACAAPRQSAPTTSPGGTAAGTAAATATPSFAGKTLNVVTGGTGGVYIIYGAGLAELLNKKLGTAASAQSTPASVDNMKLIRDGKADLAFVLSDTAYDAVKGLGRFAAPETKADAKAIAVLYNNFTHIVVRDDSQIRTIADLKGKRVNTGAAGSGTEIIANRTLEAYGIDAAKDIQRERTAVADAAAQLKDNRIDAFIWSGGLPTGAVADLTSTVKIRILDQSEGIKKMAEKYGPFYFETKIPTGTYGLTADAKVSGVANLLVVPSNIDAALVQAVLRTMFDSSSELGTIHAEAKNLKLDTATVGSPIDFHPGAIEYYKSKNAWKG